MTGLQIRSLLISVIFLCFSIPGISQALVPDSSLSPAAKSAISFYSTTLKEQLRLYNGKEYQEYILPFDEGHPYFIQTNFNKGTINYDGNTYSDVSILYNLVTDEVIILNASQVLKIQLLKERIKAFSVLGHTFLHLEPDTGLTKNITSGFYDILTVGKTSLLARRTKNIQTYTKQKLELKVFEKDHFYLKKNNTYIQIRGKKSLLEQFDDKKKEIQQYIKQNNLNYRRAAENFMIKTTEYYNQLTK
ncbi:hypothetical protein [Segetibacter aerophilus]|uniref:hypothetical protein n=1 Tax=Segetibacter aerophilus TaxID=670293 RepID=UPI0011BED32E|nr:hypothetical protein [Segetibacter aerophilus]